MPLFRNAEEIDAGKSKVKEKLKPSYIKEWVKYKAQTYNSKINYRKGIRLVQRKEPDKIIRIAFVVTYPQMWNSLKTVYEAAALNPQMKAMIACVPSGYRENEFSYSGNATYEFLHNRYGENVMNAYDMEKGEWIRLKQFHPDYVFYTRPYNDELRKLNCR